MNALLNHLSGEFEAIRKALAEGNESRADWLCRTAIEHIKKQAPDPGTDELPTFTVFCQQVDGRGTIHIASLEAEDLEAAIAAGIQTCAEDWDEENPANIHCLGVAAGDVEILQWTDIES